MSIPLALQSSSRPFWGKRVQEGWIHTLSGMLHTLDVNDGDGSVMQLPNHDSLALMEHQSALRRTANLSMIWRQDGVLWLVGSSPRSCTHSRDLGQRRRILQPIRPRCAHSQKHTEHTSLFPLANGEGHTRALGQDHEKPKACTGFPKKTTTGPISGSPGEGDARIGYCQRIFSPNT